MVTDSKEEKDGHKITKLQISVPENGDPSQVPDSVQGVPIETIPPQNFKTGGCSNNGTYDPAEGGVKIVGQDTVGTGFGKVMDMTNGEPRYLACAHVVEEKDNVSCDTGESGSANVFQGGNKIGEVAKGSVDGDWAMIEQTDDADIEGFDNDINWVDHGGRDFEEFYTEWGLRETMKNNDTLYKSGLTSGSTDGTIESIDADIEVYCGNRTVDSSGDPYGVITSVDAGPGDSGSPVFTKYPDDPDNKLSAAGLWTNYDDESDSYDSGCSAGWTNYTPEKVYERTLFIPSYYHDNEYDFQPWLIS